MPTCISRPQIPFAAQPVRYLVLTDKILLDERLVDEIQLLLFVLFV